MLHHQSSAISNVYDYLVTFPQSLRPESWSRPQEGVVKCNVDVVVVDLLSHVGYGCVVRNSFEVVLDAVYVNSRGYFCPSLAETSSIREALSWMLILG